MGWISFNTCLVSPQGMDEVDEKLEGVVGLDGFVHNAVDRFEFWIKIDKTLAELLFVLGQWISIHLPFHKSVEVLKDITQQVLHCKNR